MGPRPCGSTRLRPRRTSIPLRARAIRRSRSSSTVRARLLGVLEVVARQSGPGPARRRRRTRHRWRRPARRPSGPSTAADRRHAGEVVVEGLPALGDLDLGGRAPREPRQHARPPGRPATAGHRRVDRHVVRARARATRPTRTRRQRPATATASAARRTRGRARTRPSRTGPSMSATSRVVDPAERHPHRHGDHPQRARGGHPAGAAAYATPYAVPHRHPLRVVREAPSASRIALPP